MKELSCLKKTRYEFLNRSERELLPTTIQSFFTQNISVYGHNTRNRYHIPRYKYKSFKNSFIYQSPHLWNSVPFDIRSSTWGRILAWFRGRGSLGWDFFLFICVRLRKYRETCGGPLRSTIFRLHSSPHSLHHAYITFAFSFSSPTASLFCYNVILLFYAMKL